jgi:hypothetical protein
MRRSYRLLIVGPICFGLLACTPVQVVPAAVPTPLQTVQTAAVPRPTEIQLVQAGQVEPLTVEDPNFDEVIAGITSLTSQINALARTFFDPARFEQEIAPLPHIYVDYGEDIPFAGEGINWRARELVVVEYNGEPMLLARLQGIEDWSVYLPRDRTPFDQLMQAAFSNTTSP